MAESGAAVDVITLGEAMQLLVAEPGVALRRSTQFRSSVAGAETNVAIGLARQGFRVRWFGRVGDDPAGQSVLSQLRADGVDVSAVEVDPRGYTGLLMRDSHVGRAIAVQYYRAGSAACGLSADFVRSRGLAGARLVHVTGITPMLSPSAHEATVALMALARSAGATVSFDPNIRRKLGTDERWRAVTGPLLEHADLVFAGTDELELICGEDAKSAVSRLLDGGAAGVLLKHDDKTATVHTPEGTWHQRPLASRVVDTVGAGDALVTGYLGAWLRGATPDDALLAGAVTAALVIGAVTDTEGLPDTAELARAVAALAGGSDDVMR